MDAGDLLARQLESAVLPPLRLKNLHPRGDVDTQRRSGRQGRGWPVHPATAPHGRARVRVRDDGLTLSLLPTGTLQRQSRILSWSLYSRTFFALSLVPCGPYGACPSPSPAPLPSEAAPPQSDGGDLEDP